MPSHRLAARPLAACLTVIAAFSFASAALADDCALKKIASAPATITAGNQLLVSASIDGTILPMVFDTTSPRMGLSRAAVTRLGLPIATGREAFVFGGPPVIDRARMSELKFGPVSMPVTQALVFNAGGDGSDGKAAGQLGGRALFFDVEIDPAAGRVNFFDQHHCPGHVVYWAPEYNTLTAYVDARSDWLTTEVELDGKKLRAVIDTGASWTTMPQRHAQDLFGLGDKSPGMSQADGVMLGGEIDPAMAYTFHTLKLGDIVVNNPRIMVARVDYNDDSNTGSHFHEHELVMPDLLIGMNILKSFHLYIAYEEGVIYYTPAKPS